jgi:hypothetical protein
VARQVLARASVAHEATPSNGGGGGGGSGLRTCWLDRERVASFAGEMGNDIAMIINSGQNIWIFLDSSQVSRIFHLHIYNILQIDMLQNKTVHTVDFYPGAVLAEVCVVQLFATSMG